MLHKANPPHRKITLLEIFAGFMISVIFIGVITLLLYHFILGHSTSNNLNKNPNIGDLKTAISNLQGIEEICIADESSDPNKLLGKEGGYNAVLYFKVDEIIAEDSSQSACELGTSGGGSIEVFKNAAEAKKRNDYLSTYDGEWPLMIGTHTVLNTLVIRTSENLTNSTQKDLESKIITLLSH